MTIATALLERATTELTSDRVPADVLATVVETGTPETGHYGEDIPLLVTRTQPLRSAHLGDHEYQQSWPELHGTIINVRGANTSHNGWIANRDVRSDLGTEVRVFGAPINPAMVEGHFYRLITCTVGHYVGHVIQYLPNEQHSTLRIVQRGDGMPVVGEDGWNSWATDVFCYVEVIDPRPPATIEELVASDTDGLLDPEPETEIAPVGIPTHLPEDHLPRNIRRYAVYDEDGRGAALNPEPVIGNLYALWSVSSEDESVHGNDAHVAIRTSATEFAKVGEINRWGFEAESYDLDFNTLEGLRWVAITSTVEPHLPDAHHLTTITDETTRIEEQFNGMVTELGAMADRKGWCQEYEEVMHRGNMLGRPRYETPPAPERHAYDIEVRAHFSYDGSQPDSGVDNDLADRWDIEGVDISNISFSAYRDITIEGIVAEDETAARSSLDNDRVLEELNGVLEHISADEVTRYTITDVTEDENYDFDDDADNF